MDVRAPALIHTRGYGLAVTLYHGEGEGEGLSRSGAGSTCGARSLQVRYTLNHIFLFSPRNVINENLIANTPPVRLPALSGTAPVRGALGTLANLQGLLQPRPGTVRPISINPPPYDSPTVAMRPLGSWCARGVLSVPLHHSFR